MIRINKPQEIPKVLKEKGETETLAMCEAYENEGKRDFEFDSSIYGHKTVKEALILAQHDKCFLCESKLSAIAYGDVEHFRPKKAYRQDETDDLNYPGYYWVAYAWANLFFACEICNQRHKKNLFPLENTNDRATSHLSGLLAETPLFINPADENPEDFLSFRVDEIIGVVPFSINDNPKGEATIKGAGIDRLTLCEKRMTSLKPVLALQRIAGMNLPQPESDQAKAILREIVEEFTQNSAEFAGMFRAFFREL